jgi:protein phosphatase
MNRAAPARPESRLRWGTGTHPGLVRAGNQDSLRAQPPVFAVADGLGGHAGGERASAIATEVFAGLTGPSTVTADDVRAAAAQTSARMRADVACHPERADMATTLSALVVPSSGGPQVLVVLHIGDSRIYRLRAGSLEQLTVDHTELQELLDEGLIDARHAAQYRRRHVVTRALSAEPGSVPDARTLDVVAGDRYLLCSDGLHGRVSYVELTRILAGGHETQCTADELIAAALGAGGHDNVTVIVLDV